MLKDRNFDKLINQFEKRIYGTVKGELRLELLREDLAQLHDGEELTIFDAGCGMGQMALWFAQAGHKITGCDISKKMLARAIESFDEHKLDALFHHTAAQALAPTLPRQDLVLVHAVLEWLADPPSTLEVIADRVKPGGHLSLLFFNHHGLIYRNAMYGTWRLDCLLDESWLGKGKKLTPPYPQKPEVLTAWLEAHGFTVRRHTGIRVFHDYIMKDILQKSDMEKLLALERKYCREDTFRNMGRYIHILAQKEESSDAKTERGAAT